MRIIQRSTRLFFLVVGMFFVSHQMTVAQTKTETTKPEKKPIQLSAMIVTEENGRMIPVPFANVLIKHENRGTYANDRGFFSIVVAKGDHLHFSAVGFADANFRVPDTLDDDRYSMIQILSRDTILLAEAVIFPWPDRDNFRLEFLAMDVTNELDERAKKNLSKEAMQRVAEATISDGKENSSYYMRQQARSYYSLGQVAPMNIFSPNAWNQFFKAWQNGDFKKKEGG